MALSPGFREDFRESLYWMIGFCLVTATVRAERRRVSDIEQILIPVLAKVSLAI